MPFDGVLSRPETLGRIHPGLVDPKWSRIWARMRLGVVASNDGGIAQIDQSQGLFSGVNSTPARGFNQYLGPSLSFTGNTTQALTWTGRPVLGTAYSFATICTWVSGAGSNNFPQILGTSSLNSGLRVGSASGFGGSLGLVKGAVIALNTVSLTSGVPYFVGCSHDEASGEYYIIARRLDTGALTAATQTNTSASNAGNGNWAFGNARLDFSGAWNGQVAMGYIGAGFTPRAEMEAWSLDPWGPFREEVPLVRLVPAAVGGSASAPYEGFRRNIGRMLR